jgi:hypothetical protein
VGDAVTRLRLVPVMFVQVGQPGVGREANALGEQPGNGQ